MTFTTPSSIRKKDPYGWRYDALIDLVKENVSEHLKNKYPEKRFSRFGIYRENYDTIYMQFRALGLLTIDDEGDWVLTSYGDNYFSKIAGVLKGKTKSIQQDV